jgi:hypothetical protein
MKEIGRQFTIKDDKYGEPTTYLGANIEKVQLEDNTYAWSMTSKHNVKNLIETISDLLAEDGQELKGTFKQKSHSGPLPVSYAPELDDTPIHTQKLRGQTRQGWREAGGQGIRGLCQAQDLSVGRKGRCLLLGNFLARRTTRRNISSNNKIHGGAYTGARTITELTIV